MKVTTTIVTNENNIPYYFISFMIKVCIHDADILIKSLSHRIYMKSL